MEGVCYKGVTLVTYRWNVSTVLVIGGSGDYLDVADTVIMLDSYHALDVTEKARAITEESPFIIPSLPPLVGRIPFCLPQYFTFFYRYKII